MQYEEIEARVLRLERKNRALVVALCGSTTVAVIALIGVLWVLMPFLALRYALRGLTSEPASEGSRKPVVTGSSPSQTEKDKPAPGPSEEAEKLLSVLNVGVTAKRLLPENYESGRYRPEVEITVEAKNNSDRTVRAYQGTFDTRDLLGNQIIVLSVKDQTPIGPRQSRRFAQYFEINKFIERDTRFATENYENLHFNWKADKIIFADGTTVGSSD
jgi:hypothetical protein